MHKEYPFLPYLPALAKAKTGAVREYVKKEAVEDFHYSPR